MALRWVNDTVSSCCLRSFKARCWVVELPHNWLNCFRWSLIRWDKCPRELRALPSYRRRPHRPRSRWIIGIGPNPFWVRLPTLELRPVKYPYWMSSFFVYGVGDGLRVWGPFVVLLGQSARGGRRPDDGLRPGWGRCPPRRYDDGSLGSAVPGDYWTRASASGMPGRR